MKLIVDIDDELVEIAKFAVQFDMADDYAKSIANGTPLDKIKEKIQENINYNKKMNYQGIVTGLLLTLDIIDKYKAENEDDGNEK